MHPAVSLCTVTQAGAARPAQGELGVLGPAVTHPRGHRGQVCEGSSPWAPAAQFWECCARIGLWKSLFLSGSERSTADLSPLSQGERGDACPCVLGCCCSWGVHSSFPSFLDNPDRHSTLHPYYKLLHEIMVFMTEHRKVEGEV